MAWPESHGPAAPERGGRADGAARRVAAAAAAAMGGLGWLESLSLAQPSEDFRDPFGGDWELWPQPLQSDPPAAWSTWPC